MEVPVEQVAAADTVEQVAVAVEATIPTLLLQQEPMNCAEPAQEQVLAPPLEMKEHLC